MSRLIYLPLEPLEQRYNVMMNEAIKPHCDRYVMPHGDGYKKITRGQFLDITGTIGFKAHQLMIISSMFKDDEIQDGDVFLVGDVFFPGIESIRYMADLLGIKIRMYGFNYAGRADQNDFVRKLGGWADASEMGYHDIMDGVFVGSDYHRDQVIRYFKLPQAKVHTTGYVWDIDYITRVMAQPMVVNIARKGAIEPVTQKEPQHSADGYIIWPHRISEEKGWKEFLNFARKNQHYKFKVTTCGNPVGYLNPLPPNVEYLYNLTKREYYEVLKGAWGYLSTAHQETFGYTLQEAIYFGCKIAVPRRACYPEMVPHVNTYESMDQIMDCFNQPPVPIEFTYKWHKNIEKVLALIPR